LKFKLKIIYKKGTFKIKQFCEMVGVRGEKVLDFIRTLSKFNAILSFRGTRNRTSNSAKKVVNLCRVSCAIPRSSE